jgi:predicted amino acid dehydrogenase
MFKRFVRFVRFGQMEGLKIFGLGIIQQIVGVENFQPLQFDITPFTSGLGMGAKKGLKRYAGIIV